MTEFYVSAMNKDGYIYVPPDVMNYIKNNKLKYIHFKEHRLIFSSNKDFIDDSWAKEANEPIVF